MATTKKITMKEFNGTDYDTLYPKTNVEQVENLTPSSIGAVAKTGDTMTGNLSINKSTPEIVFKNTAITDGRFGYVMMASDKTFNIGNYLNGSNKQALYIQPETVVLKNAIRMLRTVNGVTNYYSVLHEGNLSDLGVARIATGSYVGTGTYGESNPTILSAGFPPKALFIVREGNEIFCGQYEWQESGIWIQGARGFSQTRSNPATVVTANGNTLSMYSTSSSYDQLNASGETYHYVILG